MDDRDQTTREWFFHHYLRYWYWVGIIFVFIVAAGTGKPSMDGLTFGSFLLALLLFLLLFGYYVYQRIWPGSMRGPRDKIRALFISRNKRDRARYMELDPRRSKARTAPSARDDESPGSSVEKEMDGEDDADRREEPVIVSGRLGGHPPRRSEGSRSSRPGGRPDRLSPRRPPRRPYSSDTRRSRRSRRR